jgi:hypothetical protein
MNTIEKIEAIRRRIISGSAEVFHYRNSWSETFCKEQLEETFSANESFGKSAIGLLTADELKALGRDTLYQYGFGNWDGKIVLLPLWIVSFVEPDTTLTSISGDISALEDCDKDIRYGCIAYGFVM